MARTALSIVAPLLLVLLSTSSIYAQTTTPPDPATCNPAGDVTNPNVDLVTLLTAYQSLAENAAELGVNNTCLANMLKSLNTCSEDLTKVSGCCTQGCWDAFRSPDLDQSCLNSIINATCTLAASNVTGASQLSEALFYTYSNCVNLTRVPYTCETYGQVLGEDLTDSVDLPAPAPYEGGIGCIPLYGGVGGGFYPPVDGMYPPVYGIGYPPVYGVGLPGYPPVYGVGYPPYYGASYPPIYGVYGVGIGCIPVYVGGTYPSMMESPSNMMQSPSASGSRRMARRKATALASELKALRRFRQ